MPRVQVDYDPRAEALQTTAAPNIQTIKASNDFRSSKAAQLAEALGKAGPQIDKMQEDLDRKKREKDILDAMRIPAIVARAKQESADGTIPLIQEGKKEPGLSEINNARTEDAKGVDWAKTNVARIIGEVDKNAEFITDPEKRRAYIAEEKKKLLAQIPKDRDYFLSGASNTIEKEFEQADNGWNKKSNAHMLEVQEKDFSGKVSDAMKADNPDEALKLLDNTWKVSSMIGNVRRNELVVNTFTQEAYGQRNPDLLNKIPERFLNAEAKAKIVKTRASIQEIKVSEYSFDKRLATDRREETIRSGKTDILKRFNSGGRVDPAEFAETPELQQFAISVMNDPRRPAAESAANAQRLRSSILNRATTEGVDENSIINEVLKNTYLNPSDREKLINEVPKLVEGMIAMNDDMVKSAYSTRIGASLEEAAKNPMVVLSPTLRSRTVNLFDQTIRNGFNAYYEENGKWPVGKFKRDIVDSAVDTTEKFMENQLKPANKRDPATTGAPAAAPKPATPAATGRPVPTQNDIDYVKKNPQFRQKFISTFGREP